MQFSEAECISICCWAVFPVGAWASVLCVPAWQQKDVCQVYSAVFTRFVLLSFLSRYCTIWIVQGERQPKTQACLGSHFFTIQGIVVTVPFLFQVISVFYSSVQPVWHSLDCHGRDNTCTVDMMFEIHPEIKMHLFQSKILQNLYVFFVFYCYLNVNMILFMLIWDVLDTYSFLRVIWSWCGVEVWSFGRCDGGVW